MTISSPYIATKHAATKLACLVLGVVVTFASYFAYSDSPWHYESLSLECTTSQKYKVPLKWNNSMANLAFHMHTIYCPSLMMERFFVFSNLIILIISSILLIYSCKSDPYILNQLRKRDATYYGTAGVILLIGAVLQIVSNFGVSSNKCILGFLKNPEGPPPPHSHESCAQYFLINGKHFAAALGCLESILYGVTACVIVRVKLPGLTDHRRSMSVTGEGTRGSTVHRMSIRPGSSRHRSNTPRRRSVEEDSNMTLLEPQPSASIEMKLGEKSV